ncbi:hypothetical protein PV04_07012 [Phialophora macrospora]|uniref:Uncharacterized protein n=1 Tax=Phialophora macrospora TaxID=1851006 RepID=A0A0D2FI90_9EURO|nr:hypothetical protein PV04_07012 [Phialophora macrospora]
MSQQQQQSPPADIPTKAIFRYCEPDLSVPASERSLFAQPKPINLHEETLPLHNYRTAVHLDHGPAGLDKHGFTLVEDRDFCGGDNDDAWWWGDETALRATYIPAVEALVRRVTGCRVAVVNNVAFRRRGASRYDGAEGTKFYHPRGGELDRMIEKLACDVPMVSPSDTARSLEPARGLHVDYTLRGLLDTVRHCRADISAAGADALAALDAGTRPPRVAAYSVWRPLKRVTRDPIAVLNWSGGGAGGGAGAGAPVAEAEHGRSGDKIITRDLRPFDYRAKGYQGDYLLEAYMISKPARAEDHEWFYAPDQEPHEVWVFKFADTESQYDDRVAACCGHGSPVVVGTEGEDPRESIEARVLAFW